MTAIVNYADLPDDIRAHILEIESFIGDVDGKTIVTPTDGNTFIDDGTVDAEDAVKALNAIIDHLLTCAQEKHE